MERKYLANYCYNKEGLQLILTYSSGARVKVSNIKYLGSNNFYYL